MKRTAHHLSSDSGSRSVEQEDSDDKSDIYADTGDCNVAKTKTLFQTYIFLENSGVEQIHTDCISVSVRLPGDMYERMLNKITGGGQGKQKYPPRECRAHNKREMCTNVQIHPVC
jgi:hypothetical protein